MQKILGLALLGSAMFSSAIALAPRTSSNQTLLAISAPIHTIPNYHAKQVNPVPEQIELFQHLIQYATEQKLSDRPISQIMQAFSKQLLGASYKSNLLDESNEEKLVISLDKFDCVLFVETVLALTRTIAAKDHTYSTFVNHIREQRYRDGELNGYCSRLHYFSDWINDNERRQHIQNITQQLGGIPLNKQLNFMSKHRQSYSQLATNDTNYQCIIDIEKRLNQLNINYIPTNQIRRVYSQLQPGDIIAVATSIEGLDVTHTGLVYQHPNGNIGFIHASPAGSVTIAQDLQGYIANVKNAIGIIVARPIDPHQI